MKALVSTFLLGVFTLILFSCQQEVDGLIAGPVNDDTTWLTKMISLDTTLPSGQDTVMLANYRYDAAKRLSTYDFTEFDLNNVKYTYDYKFHYRNNADTLPYMLTCSFRYNTDTDTTFYYYQNGFITRDSSINSTGGTANWLWESIYTSAGNGRYLRKRYSTNLGAGGQRFLFDSLIYYRTVLNGNVISTLDSTWDAAGFYRGRSSAQMGFDGKKSYVHRFNLWYLGHEENVMHELWPANGINNLISYNLVRDPLSVETYTIGYQYNPAGFPVISRISGNPDVNKQLFFYTKL